MSAKAREERILGVVCKRCGFADQLFESQLINSVLCPECGEEMEVTELSGRKSKKRNLKVVKEGKETSMSKRDKGKPHRTEDVEPEVHVEPETPQEIVEETTVPESETPAQRSRTPFMTQSEIWTLYATVLECKSPDQIFDTFARTFEEKWMLAWWIHRVGLSELYSFYRSRDLVDFFRKVAHEIWFRMRRGQLILPEKAQTIMWMWRLHYDVMHARSEDRIFDCFGSIIEGRSELTWWLYKTGHGDLVNLGKGCDFVEYIRKASHTLWTQTRSKSKSKNKKS